MKVTQRLRNNLKDVIPDFNRKVALGYKGFFGFENKSNPFFAPLMCATQNRGIALSTSIAVAFSKTPMVMAMESYSLNQYCQGNFTLGMASQIRPHIVRRFGMPWTDKPVSQMREYIAALHAIWDAFESGGPLNFEGETYKHTLISPEFIPYIEGFGRPKIHLGAVGPGMNRLAAEVASGVITHSFVSEKSLREINLAPIEQILREQNKPRSSFEFVYPIFIATGSNEEEYKKNIAWHRHRIGFYASTPAYQVQLELHGWGALHQEVKKMTKEGRWSELGAPITDEMLDTFTVMGEPKDIAPKIKQRFGDFVDTIQCNLELQDEEVQYEIIKSIESI
ncbi:LLM class F420-dependent oxidoreductase [Acidocella aquatica]|uniref:LLM class F420-dependent oxidoreductase n=1 Tax=Acidocella aquatica TaxID=1922313 RepID=A0ABQ6AFY6_9PROT|nr:TIGR03617 family F420-dependent LLM class oxidoreductase [Acidocella aquatica]GLR68930.1 LLM class F420-dependent oxidoreductase [Acidocella aquatica]